MDRSRALRFLKRSYREIKPRTQGVSRDQRPEKGCALSGYGDGGWGDRVRTEKYESGYFSDHLVEAAVEMFKTATTRRGIETVKVYARPRWVTCVPSLRHPELVPSFASRLAARLQLPYVEAVRKIAETLPQKEQRNSYHQKQNIETAFDASIPAEYQGEPVLLVDDMVDSRWTLTIVAGLLLERGSGPVYPLVLAESTGG